MRALNDLHHINRAQQHVYMYVNNCWAWAPVFDSRQGLTIRLNCWKFSCFSTLTKSQLFPLFQGGSVSESLNENLDTDNYFHEVGTFERPMIT